MEVTWIPCLRDNYAYLLTRPGTPEAVVIDPSAAEPVEQTLRQRGLRLLGLLCTHHHSDHTGGLAELAAAHPGVTVVAHASDRTRVPEITKPVIDDEQFDIGSYSLRVMHVPGHTRGSVAYWGAGAVFTGDTLFGCGCGRLFEGTALELYRSLQRLASLPPETRVFPGHEYTLHNLQFALSMESDREELIARRLQVLSRLETAGTSLPFTIGDELATNPFLSAGRPELWKRLGLSSTPSDEQGFAALRKKKDGFVAR